MNIDALSMDIERRALIYNSHINGLLDFCEEKEIEDYEDIYEQLHPILKKKIEQEFINRGYIRDKYRKNPMDSFFDDVEEEEYV